MTVALFRQFLKENGYRADYLGDDTIIYDKTYYLIRRLTGQTTGTFYVDFGTFGPMIHVKLD